ncbi:MAG: GHKL domain-containing protein [Lachnospiraceae bacterium]|nr:GHKL domain-containing protein [Lachnospiraceae bacterium]
MLYIVNDIAIIIFEMICCQIFLSIFLKRIKANSAIAQVISTVIISLCTYLVALFLNAYILPKMLGMIAIISVVAVVLYESSVKKSIILGCLFQTLLVATEYITYMLIVALLPDINELTVSQEMIGRFMLIINILALFICILLIKRRVQYVSSDHLDKETWLRFVFIPIYTIITILAIVKSFKSLEDAGQLMVLYMVSFGLVIVNLVVFYLLSDIVKKEIRLKDKEVLEVQGKSQLEMYSKLNENYEKQQKRVHEFKNHIMCIENMIQNKEYVEAEKYLNNIDDAYTTVGNVIDTNHIIINSVINTKYVEMLEKDITFIPVLSDLSAINMDAKDVVVLLSNLLNNAIEACEKCDNKLIKLKFLFEGESVIISVNNTHDNLIIRAGDNFITSKKHESGEHGIGIKNIIDIIEKYKGKYVIKNDDNEFNFSIIFPSDKIIK